MEILEFVSDSNGNILENIENIFIKNNILKVKENYEEINGEIKKEKEKKEDKIK